MTLHNDLTRVIEDARDHSRKNFNVEKESYGQYLARAILASDVIAQVRAEEREKAAQIVEAVHRKTVPAWARAMLDNIAARIRNQEAVE